MQWAHLASGGAGGGMRWPNRHPHVLTKGMRRAQAALGGFAALIDWPRFRRRNLEGAIAVDDPAVAAFGCGDARQAIVWLLRCRPLAPDGRLDPGAGGPVTLRAAGLAPGAYRATPWDTRTGRAGAALPGRAEGNGVLALHLPWVGPDLALAIAPAGAGGD
jgi:mannan endo-1,4-beta-mannosidase